MKIVLIFITFLFVYLLIGLLLSQLGESKSIFRVKNWKYYNEEKLIETFLEMVFWPIYLVHFVLFVIARNFNLKVRDVAIIFLLITLFLWILI